MEPSAQAVTGPTRPAYEVPGRKMASASSGDSYRSRRPVL